MRRIALVLALAACALALVAVAGMPDRTVGLRLAGVAAVAALAAIWVRSYRRGALSPLDEPIELAALFAVGLASGPNAALGLIYTGLYLRSLYGSRVRAAAGFAVYAAAHVLAVIADGGTYGIADALAQLPPLAIGCALMQAFAAMLVRDERSLERERVLRDTGAGVVTATDRGTVYGAVLGAVERLAAGDPRPVVIVAPSQDGLTVRAAAGPWLPGVVGAPVSKADLPRNVVESLERGDACALRSPRLAGLELFAPPDVAALSGVCVPLAVRGRLRGALAAFGPGVQAAEHVDALTVLAAEAALAIESIDLADQAADDRSIARLGDTVHRMI